MEKLQAEKVFITTSWKVILIQSFVIFVALIPFMMPYHVTGTIWQSRVMSTSVEGLSLISEPAPEIKVSHVIITSLDQGYIAVPIM